jgi:hypothetical protein
MGDHDFTQSPHSIFGGIGLKHEKKLELLKSGPIQKK